MQENELIQERIGKLPSDDNSLSLVPQPRLNKKMMRIVFIVLGIVVFFAIVLGFGSSPASRKATAQDEKGKMDIKAEAPSFLKVDEADYASSEKKNEPKKLSPSEILATKSNTSYGSGTKSINDSDDNVRYKTYDRSEPIKEKDVVVRENGNKSYFSTQSTTPLKDPDDEAKKSGIFFPFTSSSNTGSQKAYSRESGSEYETLSKQLENQAMTDSQKQNQQKDKNEWLSSRESDYASYLESVYMNAYDPDSEIKAGSIIPITLITGISSDLPGEIIAQTISDVYDSITGQTLLLPAGTKVIGKYNSSLSFGQDRVLLAWDRLIRPDGVSLNIRAMQGADLEGKSGLKDQTNNHLGDIASNVVLGSVFDLVASSISDFVSSVTFVSKIPQNTTYQPSQNNLASDVAKKITDKILNQQPTLEIRAGFRCNIIVNKDIILPKYDDWTGD